MSTSAFKLFEYYPCLIAVDTIFMKQLKWLMLSILLSTCSNNDTCPLPPSCLLDPDPGLCRAIITRYYYDRVSKQCKEFNWGGCGGVVPFETLEECQNCLCTNTDQ